GAHALVDVVEQALVALAREIEEAIRELDHVVGQLVVALLVAHLILRSPRADRCGGASPQGNEVGAPPRVRQWIAAGTYAFTKTNTDRLPMSTSTCEAVAQRRLPITRRIANHATPMSASDPYSIGDRLPSEN